VNPPRFEQLADWLAWQETLHPRSIDLGLERVARVYRRLDIRPTAPIITVAGTNGKGSMVAYLTALYEAAGYRVGAYTSPHLWRYNERIRLAGRLASDQALCMAFAAVDQARDGTGLTYFEFGTLAAFWLFHRAALDLWILEVGLGGRLDAVNGVDADIAVITPIGLDHTAWLGDTRDAIAREKAGILRPGRPVVCVDRDPPASLLEHGQTLGSPIFRLGLDFEARDDGAAGWAWTAGEQAYGPFPTLRLGGLHQRDNAAGALMVLELLRDRCPIAPSAIATGFEQVRLPGRLDRHDDGGVEVIFDVAHNAAAAEALAQWLAAHPPAGTTHLVLAMRADKDPAAFVAALRTTVQHWWLAQTEAPGGFGVTELAAAVRGVLPTAATVVGGDVATTVRQARAASRPSDRIVVTGSFRTVAEAYEPIL
jgi:dihydrofolate synthase/folylpolyglutamate synthase